MGVTDADLRLGESTSGDATPSLCTRLGQTATGSVAHIAIAGNLLS
jgi:hypothetical protein